MNGTDSSIEIDRTSDNAKGKRPGGLATPLPEDFEVVLAEYGEALTGSVLSVESQRTYRSRVRQFLAWLAEHRDTFDGALVFEAVHECAIRDYHHHLRHDAEPSRSARYVNSALAAIDDFSVFLGMAPVPIDRESLPGSAESRLDEEARRRWLRAASGCDSSRDTALALLAWYLPTRMEEIHALDVGDLTGDGDLRINGMPVPPDLRRTLRSWLRDREGWRGADTEPALFLNRRGGRLSVRSIYSVLGQILASADLDGLALRHVLPSTGLDAAPQEPEPGPDSPGGRAPDPAPTR